MLAFIWLVAIRICIDVGSKYRGLAIQNLGDRRIALLLQGKTQTNRWIALLLLTFLPCYFLQGICSSDTGRVPARS